MKKPKCKSTSVQAHTDLVVAGVQGKENPHHAGTVSHTCSFDEGHEGSCECSNCGFRWTKFKTVK